MKQFCLLLFCITLSLAAKAQRDINGNLILDERTVVRDSTGKVLAFDYWHPKVISGNYIINQIFTAKDTSALTLKWVSPEKKKEVDAMRTKFFAEHPELKRGQRQAASTANPPTRVPRHSQGFKNGEPMESFKETTIDGKKIDRKALKGKIVVLNFWFINCPACRDEMPELNKVAAEYSADANVVFVGLSLDQRWEIKDFLKKTPFDFQHIANARYYGDKYKVNLYPTTVVLDKEGIVRFNSVGSDNTGYWIKKTIEDIKGQSM